jgi:phosphoglycolate phosphatase
LWGKPKGLKKLQQQYGLASNECIFTGDEVRDIEAAEKADVQCVAVTWGFNTAGSLSAHILTKL